MPIVGDDQRLAQLRRAIERAGQAAAPAIAERSAPEVQQLLGGEYRRGEAPDGTPWAPLADGSGRRPLRGVLEGRTVEHAGDRVVVTLPHHAARYHQTGTRWMPARPLVPGADSLGESLPGPWRGRLISAARGAVSKLLRGKEG